MAGLSEVLSIETVHAGKVFKGSQVGQCHEILKDLFLIRLFSLKKRITLTPESQAEVFSNFFGSIMWRF